MDLNVQTLLLENWLKFSCLLDEYKCRNILSKLRFLLTNEETSVYKYKCIFKCSYQPRLFILMAKINVEIDDEDHIELKLSSTRHRTSIKKIVNRLIKNYLKEERLIREAKEGSKEAKPSVEGKASAPDKAELDEAAGVVTKKKEVS
jgi:ParG